MNILDRNTWSLAMVERIKDSLNSPPSIPGPISPDIVCPELRRRTTCIILRPELVESIKAYLVEPYKIQEGEGS